MESVQRAWDWWAYHYRVVHRTQIPGISQWDDDLVDLIVEVLGLRAGDRILDLACGSGVHALRLARRGLEVVGVDIAPSLIDHARQQAAGEGLTTCEEGLSRSRERCLPARTCVLSRSSRRRDALLPGR